MILVAIGKNTERERVIKEGFRIYCNLTKTPLADGVLSHAPSGKPLVPNRDDLKVSLSHSGEYLVIAISNEEVGVDVQEKKDIPFQAIATRYGFSAHTLDEFYQKFTLAEASAKHNGLGLAPALRLADTTKGNAYSFINGYTLSIIGNGEVIFNIVE